MFMGVDINQGLYSGGAAYSLPYLGGGGWKFGLVEGGVGRSAAVSCSVPVVTVAAFFLRNLMTTNASTGTKIMSRPMRTEKAITTYIQARGTHLVSRPIPSVQSISVPV